MSGEQSNREPAADIEIGAAAKAKKLKFRSKPETEVSFRGSDPDRSGSHTERENLPDEVEPGVEYRDVKVRWQAGAHLSGRLGEHVRERKGTEQ
jgi:hypothetical protein